MRRGSDGNWTYSPSDLVTYLRSPFATWMERFKQERPGEAVPDEETAEEKLVAAKGDEHERAWLATLTAARRTVATIRGRGDDAFAATEATLGSGAEVVYQAALRLGMFAGFADFLERVPGISRLGDFHYEIVDTKLARSPKPYFVVQLCCYAEMLEALQGVRPGRLHVVLGSGERKTYRTDDYFFAYDAVKRGFLDLMRDFDPARRPAPDPAADHGRWASYAERFAEETDHLSRVANITSGQIKKLVSVGVTTLAQLATTDVERVPKLDVRVFARLRDQARLQRRSEGRDVPEFEVVRPDPEEPRRGLALLPPAADLDVWADFEGFPLVDEGLEYLFGATTADGGGRVFHDWWAHDRAEEKRAFEGFVDFLTERHRRDPAMHVYHYAPYETTALKRLMGRHATREAEVDALLRGQVFVDLYQVVRQGVRVGAASYSIKKIERLYRPARSGDVATAGDSIVAYHAFVESGEPRDWRRSPRLAQIRDYNRDDCDSTLDLTTWLRGVQRTSGVAWIPPYRPEPRTEAAGADPDASPKTRPDVEAAALAAELLAAIPADPAERARDAERWRLQELLAQLVEFHRRELKPTFWALFERHAMSHEELVDDINCLGGLRRISDAPEKVKRSTGWRYAFDPSQDTKLGTGSKCRLSHDLEVGAEIAEMDRANGRVLLKIGAKAAAKLGGPPPATLSLIPDELVNQGPLQAAIRRLAEAWRDTGRLPSALDDLLRRRPPRVRGHAGGALLAAGEDLCDGAVRLGLALDRSTLCLQGPPGAGKTHTAAAMILAAIRAGKRVGVTANSHAAIVNLLKKCFELASTPLRCLKVGGDGEAFAVECPAAAFESGSGDGAARVGEFDLIGGTAWFFARPELEEAFDLLFVDEAGQVSLANLVAVSASAKNLVLVGDQMQLGQPIQGSHPGESGVSALDYLLAGHATIPPHFGVFLAETRRLHPRICSFISGAVYENRLYARPGTERRVVRAPASGARRVTVDAGLLFIPVEHDGNTQASDEEVDAVGALVAELLGRERTDVRGAVVGRVTISDFLFVAPYNLQVRRLQAALPAGAKVGSVDRFQGQEAPIVVVSMCASDAESSPRGIDFLFDRHRLNVAVSRAQSLALVVAHPGLARTRCSSVEQLALVNTFCRIVAEGGVRASAPSRSRG